MPRVIGEKRDIQPIADARPPLLPEREKKGIQDAHASKGYGEKGRENKGERRASALPSILPRRLIILPHRTRCQPARAAETDEGTGHKHQYQPQDDFIVGKTVHEQQQNEEAGKPDFQDGQAKQPPGPPSEPGTDTGPKSDDAQRPKKDAETLSTRTSR